MIRVLIVEDEPPIMRDLTRRLEKLDSTFTVVAQAYDGVMALELLAKQPVDLIITDITMPRLSGLDLLEKVAQNQPHILRVILSGYQEFSYAQKALRLGAEDYLSKPIKDKELAKLLEKIKATFQTQHLERLEQYLHHVFQEEYLLTKMENPFIPVADSLFVSLICLGNLPLTLSSKAPPGARAWADIIFSQERNSSSIEGPSIHLFAGKTRSEKLSILPQSPDNLSHIRDIYQQLQKATSLPVSLIYTHCSPEELVSMIPKLRKQLLEKIRFARGLAPFPWENSSTVAGEIQDYQLPSGYYQQACLAVEQQQGAHFKRLLQKVILDLEHLQARQLDVESALQRLFDPLLQAAPYDTTASGEGIYSLAEQILLAPSYAELEKSLSELASHIFQTLLEASHTDQLVEDLEQYLLLHLGDPISNQHLTTRFGYSISYISRLFKNQTGYTPGEYLLNQRITKAKELLVQEPKLKSKEIARIVGYSDPLYFSRVFKKATGYYPSEYRENAHLDEKEC